MTLGSGSWLDRDLGKLDASEGSNRGQLPIKVWIFFKNHFLSLFSESSVQEIKETKGDLEAEFLRVVILVFLLVAQVGDEGF